MWLRVHQFWISLFYVLDTSRYIWCCHFQHVCHWQWQIPRQWWQMILVCPVSWNQVVVDGCTQRDCRTRMTSVSLTGESCRSRDVVIKGNCVIINCVMTNSCMKETEGVERGSDFFWYYYYFLNYLYHEMLCTGNNKENCLLTRLIWTIKVFCYHYFFIYYYQSWLISPPFRAFALYFFTSPTIWLYSSSFF